jgi:hypothetical protein
MKPGPEVQVVVLLPYVAFKESGKTRRVDARLSPAGKHGLKIVGWG